MTKIKDAQLFIKISVLWSYPQKEKKFNPRMSYSGKK